MCPVIHDAEHSAAWKEAHFGALHVPIVVGACLLALDGTAAEYYTGQKVIRKSRDPNNESVCKVSMARRDPLWMAALFDDAVVKSSNTVPHIMVCMERRGWSQLGVAVTGSSLQHTQEVFEP